MAKKGNLNLLYLIGMALVVVGSFLPIIRISLGFLGNIDFTIIDAFRDLSDLDSWLALLMFAAAIVGVVFCFVGNSNGSMIKTCALIVSVVLGLIFFARGGFFKNWFKITGFGFYVIIAGWVVACIGNFTSK